MKKIVYFILFLLAACAGGEKGYPKAENALDAGREFISSCAQGDFARAGFYLAPGAGNEERLKEIERRYRQEDREGRQQLRTASINIREIAEINDSTTLIYYSNTPTNSPEQLQVIKQNGNWLVNFPAAVK